MPTQLSPCPFCASPLPKLRKIFAGPVQDVQKRGRNGQLKSVRDYGEILGWLAYCHDCNARVERRFVDYASQKATRAAAIEAWNRREAYSIVTNHWGLLPCPLCGQKDIRARIGSFNCTLYQRYFENAEYIECEGCKLRMTGIVPDHSRYHFQYIRRSVVPSWNQRKIPSDYTDPKAWKEAQLTPASEQAIQSAKAAVRAERKARFQITDGGKPESKPCNVYDSDDPEEEPEPPPFLYRIIDGGKSVDDDCAK